MPKHFEQLREQNRVARDAMSRRIEECGIQFRDVSAERNVPGLRIQRGGRGSLRATLHDGFEAESLPEAERQLYFMLESLVDHGAGTRPRFVQVFLRYLVPIDFPDLKGERVWSYETNTASWRQSYLNEINPHLLPICDYYAHDQIGEEQRRELRARLHVRISPEHRMAPASPVYLGIVFESLLKYLICNQPEEE